MKTVSVILPTYNESENIVLLISNLLREVQHLKEIVVMDDDSPDNTARVITNWIRSKKYEHVVKVIRRQKNHGLRQSISEGIQRASGEIVVWLDADFSHPPEVIQRLVLGIELGNDIAVASRYCPGGFAKPNTNSNESAFSNTLSISFNYFVHQLFRIPFYDFTSGFVAVRKRIMSEIPLSGSYGEYFIDFIVRAYDKKFKIIEVPYTPAVRLHGSSKTAPTWGILVQRIVQYAGMVIRLFIR